ncbi:hypothetical protein BABINDRAFT_52526 [Babjeviella inositovora NRRL Y-12698]|uniref:Ribosomal RNA-processing protein 14/surfeit locus protein 6 C-terminal domain-containing protein n=1 Tax=Babjeviella inositovora NRRL Y-12698 TaxID=984486 RepID=A0A1E3QLI8_9ASCO|nr:uncharacterized protein BABINDRAFT_52526 [Babjeviella inositovora NRRL Y-12698]ODQ78569.1 hypothetical protein BABINDRAFT_52526 [Babjeviella inositovora NRRL Y-12698]
MSKSLEERLKTHSSAFDGLLSLIPAKFYYDSATQDQWQQKKKSKDELRENKRAKLDPEAAKNADDYNNFGASAKEVLDNKQETSKPVVLPGKRVAPTEPVAGEAEASDSDMSDNGMDVDSDLESGLDVPLLKSDEELDVAFDDEGQKVEVKSAKALARAAPVKKELSPEEQKAKDENLRLLREKLANRIQALKQKRRAPGTNVPGAPKSRDQILEERKRKKEELKKRRHEEMEKEKSDSESSDDDSEGEVDTATANNVLFQNIEFSDGSKVTSDLTAIRTVSKKKKGPANNDIKAHLRSIEKNKEKLSTLSPEDRAKKEDQQKWTRVMAQAEGKKVKDDVNLLKKSLRKKEAGKRKSAGEWVERKENVTASIAAKVKRREDNLQLRKENKGVKGKKQQKMLKSMKGVVDGGRHKKRAGFEGKTKNKKGGRPAKTY